MLSRAPGERTQVEQQVLSSRIPSLLDVRMVCLTIWLRGSDDNTRATASLPLGPHKRSQDEPSHMLGQLG